MGSISEMRANLPIYRQAMDFYKVEVVVPYEEYLIEFLSTHTDKSDIYEDNYLDALNSVHSIGRCHRFARYLALGLKGPFKLIEGNLSALNKVRFDHCWIETEDSVYDVSFSGKWPKETYYKLFKPTSQKVIDLDKDPTFARIKANMVAAKVPSKEPHLKYISWYGYTHSVVEGWPTGTPGFYLFPEDERKVEEEEAKTQVEEHTSAYDREEPPADVEVVEYFVNQKYDICITKYGAFMGNSTLLYGATEKEKEEYLKSEYWQEYVRMGYKLVIAPSFFHPEFLAVYVVNWEDPRVINEGYPGIIRYSVTFNQSHETKGPLL